MSAQNKKDEIKATVERLRQSNNDLNQATGIYNVTRQTPLVEKSASPQRRIKSPLRNVKR